MYQIDPRDSKAWAPYIALGAAFAAWGWPGVVGVALFLTFFRIGPPGGPPA